MFDHHVKFSFKLMKEEVGEDVVRDVHDALYALNLFVTNPHEKPNLLAHGLPPYLDTEDMKEVAEGWFGINFEMKEDGLWLYNEAGAANHMLLHEIIHEALNHHHSDAVVGYAWSQEWNKDCPIPCTDSFGGGFVTISRNGIYGENSYDRLCKVMEEKREELTASDTPKQQQGVCPKCGCKELEFGEFYPSDGDACYYEWRCSECAAAGYEWFNLVFTEYTVYGE